MSYTSSEEQSKVHGILIAVSPLKFYSETNISSRPSKRGKSYNLTLKDLRAIPFVGAWSQLKQNVPGYYGVGTALQELDQRRGNLLVSNICTRIRSTSRPSLIIARWQ